MFCEICGKKIDTDSIYCEHCGTKVTKEKRILDANVSKKENRILFLILLFVVFGFIFFQELKYFNSPQNAMNNFMKQWKNENYDVILDELNIPDETFLSSELFPKVYRENLDEMKIKDYKVLDCTLNENLAQCEVSLELKTGGEITKRYDLQRKKDNKFFLFADWNIFMDSVNYIKDYKFYLPKGTNVTIAGESMNSYLIEDSKEGYDCYQIPYLFKGTYLINMYINGQHIEKEVRINSTSFTYQFSLNDLSDAYKDNVKNLGKEVITVLYEGVIGNKKFEELDCIYEIGKLKEIYEKLQKEINSEVTLTSFQIKDLKIMNLKLTEIGEIEVTFQMNYDYIIKYKTENEEKEHQGKSNDTFYLTIKNSDLKEVIDCESLISYFSKKY